MPRALRAGKQDVVDHTQNRSIEFAAALTLPATVALLVIPYPIIAVLFERGAFTAADTAATAPALAAYAAGLARLRRHQGAAAGFLRARGHLAPRCGQGGVSMVVNVVAAFALFYFFGHVGIAAATSLAAWINTVYLVVGPSSRAATSTPMLRCVAGCRCWRSHRVLMGVVVYGRRPALAPWLLADSIFVRAAVMAALVSVGVAFFALFCQFAGVVDFRRVFGAGRSGPTKPD